MKIRGHEISGRMSVFQKWGRDAIREGRKTQTRRTNGLEKINENPDIWECEGRNIKGSYIFCPDDESGEDYQYIKCSYKPGEIRVMREPLTKRRGCVAYLDDLTMVMHPNKTAVIPWRWKRDTLSQMFMPTEYGRTLLEITDVWAERLNDISEEDCIAEGSQTPCDQLPKACQQGCMTERTQYSRIWDEINGPGAWELNEWVYVYSFKEVEP